jgi:hypothetical protein
MPSREEFDAASALYEEAVALYEAAKADFEALQTALAETIKRGRRLTTSQWIDEERAREKLFLARVRLEKRQPPQ